MFFNLIYFNKLFLPVSQKKYIDVDVFDTQYDGNKKIKKQLWYDNCLVLLFI